MISLQFFFQGLQGTAQLGLDGAKGNACDLGDFPQGQILPVAQKHQFPGILRQLPYQLPKKDVRLQLLQAGIAAGRLPGQILQGHISRILLPPHIHAGVCGDSV